MVVLAGRVADVIMGLIMGRPQSPGDCGRVGIRLQLPDSPAVLGDDRSCGLLEGHVLSTAGRDVARTVVTYNY